ncbi:MAG: segregation/condensation protein A [Clostridia bacterium]|nr:segregation/condensation protein A [Clostridia bacterium]
MEPIIYKIETFEGPLDLLLSLISKNKMDILDIKISIICDQYLEYIASMESMDIDLSSDFLVMASHLMLLKSRMLLPRPPSAPPDEDLIELQRILLEHQVTKQVSGELGKLYSVFKGRLEKDTDEISPDRSFVTDHEVGLLSAALLRVMSNIEASDEEASANIKPLISTRTVSVGEKVFSILRTLIMNGGSVEVTRCFLGIYTKHEAVATFMALLEMLKAGRITIRETEFIDEEGVITLCNGVYIDMYTGKIKVSEENQ